METERLLQLDRQHCWHPYTSFANPDPVYAVERADGVHLTLRDGRRLIDGMSSWWCAIHGYNHPRLNRAASQQLQKMSHVMFGGLTHEPAVRLVEKLVALTPPGLERVFLADTGSVAVEVAIKMALQYWHSRGEPRTRLLSLRKAYHGDTSGAMSLCDPINGMHHIFSGWLPQQLFAPAPPAGFNRPLDNDYLEQLERQVQAHKGELAALIIEPLVQGAGGMHIYAPAYVRAIRDLCDRHDLLLIADEIATGFGRTGDHLFACDHAGVAPDILCVGKALTGGYMTLAATLTNALVADTISAGEPGNFMHGPTFMGNPLACAVACESLELLGEGQWPDQVAKIEKMLNAGLGPCRGRPGVRDVRVLGAIGVVEMEAPVEVARVQAALLDRGVWLRPFGRLIYTMPPYVIGNHELAQLCEGLCAAVELITKDK